jgi:hypothetical protein
LAPEILMPTTATRIETEILDQEKQMWEASSDPAKLRALTADTMTFVMGEGISTSSRDEFIKTMEDYKLKSYRMDASGAVVRELGPNAATVAYHATQDFTMNGEDQSTSSYYTSTWVRDGGGWKCTFVTESPKAKGGA